VIGIHFFLDSIDNNVMNFIYYRICLIDNGQSFELAIIAN
jgi:hypothetical protein